MPKCNSLQSFTAALKPYMDAPEAEPELPREDAGHPAFNMCIRSDVFYHARNTRYDYVNYYYAPLAETEAN